MAKASRLEMLEREKFINGLIALGESRTSIISQVAKKYKIADSSAERQYYQILKSMSTRLAEERELIRMELAQQLEDVQREAKQAGLNKVVIEAINSRAKLLGLNEKVEKAVEPVGTIIFKEQDMSTNLEVVPEISKVKGK
jgi:sulfatase maturation enzyme AslB (radical SAM superfamily)